MAEFLGKAVERRYIRDLDLAKGELSTVSVNKFMCGVWCKWPALLSAFLFAVVGGSVGWWVWGIDAGVGRLALLVVLPAAWGLSASRWSGWTLMLGYFLAGARGLPGGTAVFFGDAGPWWSGWVFWLSAGLLLSLPFLFLWAAKASGRGWRFVLAVGLGVLPPLGLCGWVSPISVAGALFPDMGWVGLVLAFGVLWSVAGRSGWRVGGLLAVALLANSEAAFVSAAAPVGWVGVNTRFSQLSSGGGRDAGAVLESMRRVEWVKRLADEIPAGGVRVLPETVLGEFTGVTEFSLSAIDASLSARGARLLVGAEVPRSDGRYLNSLIVLGAEASEGRQAVQGIPVPFSMWKPWATDGAVANVFGNGGLVVVKGLRAGVLICYEQLLTFSMLKMMWERPDVLVGAANVWWVKGGTIPVIQKQMLGTYGRLFGVGVVGAWNY